MSDREAAAVPVPASAEALLWWWQAAAEHRLVIQRCSRCSTPRHPPRPICARCQSFDYEWQELSGRGTVYTYTVVHQVFSPETADRVPYAVVSVELEGGDGIRMSSNLDDLPPEGPWIGMPVEVVWDDLSEDVSVPRFRQANP